MAPSTRGYSPVRGPALCSDGTPLPSDENEVWRATPYPRPNLFVLSLPPDGVLSGCAIVVALVSLWAWFWLSVYAWLQPPAWVP